MIQREPVTRWAEVSKRMPATSRKTWPCVGVDRDPLALAGLAPRHQRTGGQRPAQQTRGGQRERHRARAVVARVLPLAVAAAPLVGRARDAVAGLDDLLDGLGRLQRRQRDAVAQGDRLVDRVRATAAPGSCRARRPKRPWSASRRCRSGPGSAAALVAGTPAAPATGSTALARELCGSGGSETASSVCGATSGDVARRAAARLVLTGRAEREIAAAERGEAGRRGRQGDPAHPARMPTTASLGRKETHQPPHRRGTARLESLDADRLGEVLDEVLGASIPHESRTRSAGTAAAGALDGLVRHRLRDLDQRLHAAERLGQREEPRRGDDPRRVRDAGTRPSRRTRASGRRRRPRRPPATPTTTRAFSVCAAIRSVQRAQPAVHEEAVQRPGHGADRVLHEAHGRRAAPGRARRPRRRRRPSARRGTWSSSARRRPRRAPAAAGRPAWRTCCRPRRTRRRARATIARHVDHLQRRVRRRLDPHEPRVRRAPRPRPRRGRSGRPSCTRGPSARAPCRRAGRSRRRGRRG